ncbi:hypothetical protein GF389_03710 [Candidatus Dojkabacteria bacterium]|nr:hypothetical protein [Candidatus Dojkabacteria bacterium]
MKIDPDKEKAIKIISDNLYTTVSVKDEEDTPWIANLYFVHDSKFNIYWYSPKNSRHSRAIEKNPTVAFAFFDSTATGDDVDAVYMQAKAYVITDMKELLHGMMEYGKKMLRTKFVNSKQAMEKFAKQYTDFKGDSPLRMYKATPTKIWKLAPSDVYNDKYVDSRIEINI